MTGTQGANGRFKRIPVEDRFWTKVDRSGGDDACWLWTGALEWTGYGRITDYWQKHSAHRFAYEFLVGPIPEGMQVCHTCDVRHCVNPRHLFLGTAYDNMQDAARKGKMSGPRNLTHVRRGEDGTNARLSEADVVAIRAAYTPRSERGRRGAPNGAHAAGSLRALAAEYGVSFSAIHAIVTRKTWAHLP